jgi:hypothetical protein
MTSSVSLGSALIFWISPIPARLQSRLECWVTLESRFRRQAKRKTRRRGETRHISVRCGSRKTLFDRLHLFCPFY